MSLRSYRHSTTYPGAALRAAPPAVQGSARPARSAGSTPGNGSAGWRSARSRRRRHGRSTAGGLVLELADPSSTAWRTILSASAPSPGGRRQTNRRLMSSHGIPRPPGGALGRPRTTACGRRRLDVGLPDQVACQSSCLWGISARIESDHASWRALGGGCAPTRRVESRRTARGMGHRLAHPRHARRGRRASRKRWASS